MRAGMDDQLRAELNANDGRFCILVKLALRSKTEYIWSGVGPLVWDAQTYSGVGTLGQIGDIVENTIVRAEGTTLTLSGVDPSTGTSYLTNDMMAEALTDVQVGAPCRIYLGALDENINLVGAPYLLFRGVVDKPPVLLDPEHPSIQISVESRMINHERATNRRYTATDQRDNGNPNDSGFNGVEALADQGLKWGVA